MATPVLAPRLPRLPDAPGGQWENNIRTAYRLLKDSYKHAYNVLQQDDGDPVRLATLSDSLMDNSVPVLEAMDAAGMPSDWIEAASYTIAPLVMELKLAALAAEGIERNNIEFLEPMVQPQPNARRKRGRPRKEVNPELLAEVMDSRRNITLTTFAKSVGMHPNTLRKRLREKNLERKFDELSDQDLDILVKRFKKVKPSSGLRYLVAFLRSHGLRIPRVRVQHAVERVDPVGRVLRQRETITRRKYTVPRPNSLWHLDGHHKLIWWGIVIHGFIDGYDRTVTGLRAGTNNRASTVLELFLEGMRIWGTPSRVRGDRGGENILVSIWMIMHRGPNRASFMWGSSKRNTRIERLWVEVGTQFARQWRAFFTRLGRLHHLDRKNPAHLWLLHLLFLDIINEDCAAFQREWNLKPIRGKETHNQSPLDMRLLGMLKNGIYAEDPMDQIDPISLEMYYGNGADGTDVAPAPAQVPDGPPGDGAGALDGASDEEEEEEYVQVAAQIAQHQERNVRHAPVRVARHKNPFDDCGDPQREATFRAALEAVHTANILPPHYGLEDDFQDYEHISYGAQGKSLRIPLPPDLWAPRAIIWAQGLAVLNEAVDGLP